MNFDKFSSIIFLPVILLIGIITSLEDYRWNKIRNVWVSLGLGYSFLVYLSFFVVLKLADYNMSHLDLARIANYFLSNFDKWSINLAVSILVAIGLWYFSLWGAGDAKLFICYSALIPISQYSRGYFDYYFASFFLLLAIFIPATAYLLFRSVLFFINKFNYSEVKKITIRLVKDRCSKNALLKTTPVFLGFIVLFLFFRLLAQELEGFMGKFFPRQSYIMVISLFIFQQLTGVFRKFVKSIFLFFILLVIYIVIKRIFFGGFFILAILNAFSSALFIMILFPLCKKIIDLYAQRSSQAYASFAPWMFLGSLIVWFT